MTWYAHSAGGGTSEWQELDTHLENVAHSAAGYARLFEASEWAELVGLAHDLGKATEAFQSRLKGAQLHVDHSSAGARILSERYGTPGKLLAYLCVGHHGGLPNHRIGIERSSLLDRLGVDVHELEGYLNTLDFPSYEDVLKSIPPQLKGREEKQLSFAAFFLLRMIFSCLVDADYLDTEAHFSPDFSAYRSSSFCDLATLETTFEKYMQNIEQGAKKTPVNLARCDIRKACLESASESPGLFTLTVPTGGGKTFASLSFALKHAQKNGLRRIIYVVPFTTIVEQSAEAIRRALSPAVVLEHHATFDYSKFEEEWGGEQNTSMRLAAENWDMPVIVTTNVQFFESLFSDKSSRSRKIHNIANSVVILDEAQALPDAYLKPCLAALEELSGNYKTSVVLCSATQPALDTVWPFSMKKNVYDIVGPEKRHTDLFEKRVSITSVGMLNTNELVEKLKAEEQVLCIVSTRSAAGFLYDKLSEQDEKNAFHLSAHMIPKHRTEVVSEIKACLLAGEPCKVVSTQLIEAGVDIDFPVVYREMAGIDSMRQAAGRCNREGRHEQGNLYIFECEDFPKLTKGWLAAMRQLGKETIEVFGDSLGEDAVEYFFKSRYQVEQTDSKGILNSLCDESNLRNAAFDFETIGNEFELIDSEGISLFIPWKQEGMALLNRLRAGEVERGLFRQLQSYTVEIPIYLFKQLEEESAITRYGSICVMEPRGETPGFYSEKKGVEVNKNDSSGLLLI